MFATLDGNRQFGQAQQKSTMEHNYNLVRVELPVPLPIKTSTRCFTADSGHWTSATLTDKRRNETVVARSTSQALLTDYFCGKQHKHKQWLV